MHAGEDWQIWKDRLEFQMKPIIPSVAVLSMFVFSIVISISISGLFFLDLVWCQCYGWLYRGRHSWWAVILSHCCHCLFSLGHCFKLSFFHSVLFSADKYWAQFLIIETLPDKNEKYITMAVRKHSKVDNSESLHRFNMLGSPICADCCHSLLHCWFITNCYPC